MYWFAEHVILFPNCVFVVAEHTADTYCVLDGFEHVVHEVAPAAEYDVPAVQLVHEDAPAAEYVPAVQLVHEDAPAAEYFPASQFVHEVAPAAEYFPAAHFVHVGVLTELS